MMVNASGTSLSSSTFVVPNCSPYKENVYSFGILLLELVTFREPSTWINSLADRSREVIMFDENFMEQGFDDEIRETRKMAEKCVQVQTDGEISMLQVYQAMCATGISNNEILVDFELSNVPRLTLGRIRKEYIPTTATSHFPTRETRDLAKQSKEYRMGNRKENVNAPNTDNKQ
ncbi:probably inactive leucine-rich repeat receptor-like protein kinase [Tanacetum coccineum]